MEAIIEVKPIGKKHTNFKADPDQLLNAQGASNIFGFLFQSNSTTGGFSRRVAMTGKNKNRCYTYEKYFISGINFIILYTFV